jgi:hypothetical protein
MLACPWRGFSILNIKHMINIYLVSKGNLPHLQQIYSGLNMLEYKNVCKVDVLGKDMYGKTFGGVMDLFPDNKPICLLNIDGAKVVVDTLDGYNFNDSLSQENNLKLMDKIADEADFYFKRSYSDDLNASLRNRSKIYPLGLNYQVNDRKRNIQKKLSKKSLKKYLLNSVTPPLLGSMMSVESFEQYPFFKPKEERTILFMTRLWDYTARRDDVNEQRKHINKTRIEAIKALKNEFGSAFYGGIFPNKMSEKYPDLILSRFDTQKCNYIKRLRSSSICIATTGLHNSIGWKMAEYVAASKCIISESLQYNVAGNFIKGVNYLEYTDVETLISSVHKLLDDDDLYFNMQISNYRYYNEYLRPDSLMLNLIAKVKNLI